MWLSSPHVRGAVPATRATIATLIPSLAGREDPFAIVGMDDRTYMQTLWTGDGFVLEYQDGSVHNHHRTTRSDLDAEIVVDAFASYVDSVGRVVPDLDFERVGVQTPGYRLGHLLGRFFGGVKRGFEQARRRGND